MSKPDLTNLARYRKAMLNNCVFAPVYPKVLRIEATNHCNAKCTFCPRDEMTRPMGIMSVELFKKILDDCPACMIRSIHLHNFGESLLDKQLATKIAYAKATRGIEELVLITNGELLTEKTATSLMNAGLDSISISMDANGKESYESTRLGLHYDKLVANVEGLIALRNRMNSKLKIALTFVYRDNDSELMAFIDRWKPLVDETRGTYLHNWAVIQSPKPHVSSICSRPWKTMTVLWDGRVSLCCIDLDGTVILGDVTKQSMKEVWTGLQYARARLEHLQETGPKICLTCDLPCHDSLDWIPEIFETIGKDIP